MSARPSRRAALLALLAALLSACGAPPSGPAEQGPGPAPLRIATSFDIGSLDPVEDGFWMPEFGVAETPMRVGQEGEIQPWTLESLARADDLTWVLTLREGVTFQNGTPVDGVALAATMTRQLTLSPAAQAQLEGSTVTATGPRQVTLITPEPNASVPHLLADESVFPIYDAAAVDAVGRDYAALAGAGIYTGPYAVRSLDAQRMELDPYPRHWAGIPPLPGVTVRFVPDPQARILAVQNGEVDIALYVPTDAKQILDGDPNAFFVTPPRGTGTGTGTVSVPLNQKIAPFDDLAVRKAFIAAIDYRSLADDILQGAYDRAESLFPTVYPFAVRNLRTDTAAAAALLDAAGWVPGPDGVRTRDGRPLTVVLLTYPQQPDTTTIAVAMQSQLRALGFDVRIRQVEDVQAAVEELPDWNAAVVFNSTAGFTGTPEPFLRRYLVTSGDRNSSGVSDPELDALAGKLRTAFDDAERDALLARVQQIVIEEGAYMTVAAVKRFPVVTSPEWRGYVPSNSLNHVTADTRPAS